MMTLVEQLKHDDERKARQAAEQYRQAVAKAEQVDGYRELLDGGDPAKLPKLRAAMATLGLTADDVEADARAIAAHRAALAAVLPPDAEQRLRADVAAEHRAVREDGRAALHKLVDLIPTEFLLDALYGSGPALAGLVRTAADRPTADALVDPAPYAQRFVAAGQRLQDAVERSRQAEREVARLVDAHPRVLGTAIIAADVVAA